MPATRPVRPAPVRFSPAQRWLAPLAVATALLLAVGQPGQALAMSEKAEIKLGREQHQKVLAEMGAYDDDAVQGYVTELGHKLALKSDWPKLEWTFTVLDTEDVNAFALPGGFVYVSRGILPYLNSEAELAAVLGHEIGHVTAHHGAKRQTRGTLANLGAAAATILTGQPIVGDLANVAGAAWVSGYGREQELEADRLGAEILARTGYDPQAMTRVIASLKDQESSEVRRAKAEGRKPHVYHGVFASHPDNDQRLQEAVKAAKRVEGRATGQDQGREVYLKRVDGVAIGTSRAQGVVRGSRFYHADMGITLAFPSGWAVQNEKERVLAVAPDKNSVMQVTVDAIPPKAETPRKYFAALAGNFGSVGDARELDINGSPAYTAVVRGTQTPFGIRPSRVVIIQFNNQFYRIDGASRGGVDVPEADGLVLSSASTFRRLKEAEFALAEPDRLKVVKAAPGTTLAGLAKNSPLKTYAEETLRLYNGFYPKGEPEAGSLVKTVR
jgi:predicted Zn-dependent protease